jgi:hypothetical protein
MFLAKFHRASRDAPTAPCTYRIVRRSRKKMEQETLILAANLCAAVLGLALVGFLIFLGTPLFVATTAMAYELWREMLGR